ncbi:hypothetical protein P167DRAFT_532782 [Morchella conica CCBAS932]|uniref:Uncharacterized protein n=1 Tax=Morchella conica CCBAS932 TaxID=1392247 RepID=A0A3N4KZ45_9PEZI|nr:hypothetical protein P167DRAFT_532782 [Morchella conica CCBAS932]
MTPPHYTGPLSRDPSSPVHPPTNQSTTSPLSRRKQQRLLPRANRRAPYVIVAACAWVIPHWAWAMLGCMNGWLGGDTKKKAGEINISPSAP